VGARRAIRSHLRLCRVDGRLGTYLRTRLSYPFTCMPLTVAATVGSASLFVLQTRRVADYARPIDVAFPLTSARRSSGYAGQLIADCCGGFPSLAADLPAVVFGAGACPEIRPSAGLDAWRAHA